MSVRCESRISSVRSDIDFPVWDHPFTYVQVFASPKSVSCMYVLPSQHMVTSLSKEKTRYLEKWSQQGRITTSFSLNSVNCIIRLRCKSLRVYFSTLLCYPASTAFLALLYLQASLCLNIRVA
jgi:predicted phosphatase